MRFLLYLYNNSLFKNIKKGHYQKDENALKTSYYQHFSAFIQICY